MITDCGYEPTNPNWNEWYNYPFCSCVFDVEGPRKENHEDDPSAYYKCENCFGYGVMPIPLRDLK